MPMRGTAEAAAGDVGCVYSAERGKVQWSCVIVDQDVDVCWISRRVGVWATVGGCMLGSRARWPGRRTGNEG